MAQQGLFQHRMQYYPQRYCVYGMIQWHKLLLVCWTVWVFQKFQVSESFSSPPTEKELLINDAIQKAIGAIVGADNFQVHFYFYSRKNSNYFQELVYGDAESITNSNFNPDELIKVIIHGMVDGVNRTTWQKKMKDEFLKIGDHNVILVDWSGGAKLPPPRCVVNSPNAANQIANFLWFLMEETGANVSSIHLLGHSQGAQICGLVGQMIPGIPRISGMDPSGDYVSRLPPDLRLSSDDADFVDVIQTNGEYIIFEGFGAIYYLGSPEFVANGGRKQPDCDLIPDITTAVHYPVPEAFRRFIACSHYRSVDLYTEFIKNEMCPLVVAYACSNYTTFLQGKCVDCNGGETCAIVGYRATEFQYRKETTGVGFFFETSGTPPYCLYHYQILVKISDQQRLPASGNLKITLTNRDNVTMATGWSGVTRGAEITTLYTSKSQVPYGDGQVLVQWRSNNFRLLNIAYIRILPMNYIDEVARNEETWYYCRRFTPVVYNLQTKAFRASDCLRNENVVLSSDDEDADKELNDMNAVVENDFLTWMPTEDDMAKIEHLIANSTLH